MTSIWLVGRGQPYWEEEFLCRRIVERGVRAHYVPAEKLPVDPHDLRADGVDGALPTVMHVRSDAYTRLPRAEIPLFYDMLEMAEEFGVRLVNRSRAIRRVRHKLRQAAWLDRAGIPVPRTRGVSSLDDVNATLRDFAGAVVVKPPYGHASLDLVLLGARAATVQPHEEILLWHLLRRHGILLAQQQVAPLLRELRVAVIGDRVTLCYELRKVYENSGLPTALVQYERRPAEPTEALTDLATRTTASLELDVALLDIADTGTGLVVIEANGSIAAWRDVHQVRPFDTTSEGIGDCYASYLADLAEWQEFT